MNLVNEMLGENQIREFNDQGELLPDPHLIFNIDHIFAFLEIELIQWEAHKARVESSLNASDIAGSTKIMFDDCNRRFYLKSLLSTCTYYVACVEAIDKLMNQMYRINNQNGYKLKKPKLLHDKCFHEKAKFIRNKSFIHQDSNEIPNPMDKRVAMDWNVLLSGKIGEPLGCEDYQFGHGGWWVEVNGVKTESSVDLKVSGFSSFCNAAIEQLNIRKQRAIGYFQQLSSASQSEKT
ncbi:hypothetical protein PO80_09320 [Vibrio parahaemolyticus]|uniref:hypothetical protein n=1 Tax=Vibrio parahaemolyticus TaxID=670 RepID=UPI000542541E|nr:hypothetical protein [Vibrio parahaemolyticus]KHF15851.1 hypothetical protein PO80_09320 [Vibrio parahaemolyticus]MBE3888633.1 hypothetical protein [Vibrio parahaemolyticus]OTV93173.1 hypothetical protein BA739_24750 [Vibrio parahaemolyticus]OTV97483.1 hypothetical protein BA740_24755 [Vibrio parahaemolyticus]TNY65268.1 hypothetical protein CGK67_02820 [Vibrio parahaemolyticus]